MEDQEKIKKKPKWLRALEQQSWQAELIVSGVAIYGTLQLPYYVDNFANWTLLNQSEEVLSFGYLFFQYLNIASIILVLGFITHFVMRTVWIGMIGLVSVYPKGIVKNQNRYSDSFSEQMIDEFGDIDSFNKKLDDTCSVILSATIGIFLVMLVFSFWIIVGLFVWIGLYSILGDGASIIIKVIIGILGFFMFSLIYMNDKKNREKDWVKKWHYPIASRFTKVFFLFFSNVYAYIMYTIGTNYKREKEVKQWKILVFGFGIGMAFAVLGFLTASITKSTNQQLFFQNSYYNYQSYPDISYNGNYQNIQNSDEYYFCPSIQSEYVPENFLRLQIPVVEREELSRVNICGEFVDPRGTFLQKVGQLFLKKDTSRVSRLESNRLKDEFELECANEYYTIFIDDIKENNLQFSFYRSENQEYYLTHIPIGSLELGNHLLKLEKEYKNDDGENAVQFIRFYKE